MTPEPGDIDPDSRLSDVSMSLCSSVAGADLTSVLPAALSKVAQRPDWSLASLLEDTLPSTFPDGLVANDGRHELMGVGFWDVKGINRANLRLDAPYVLDQVAMARLFEFNEMTDMYATQK